jgi:GNAT superfamily N-acetyltransferase
VIRPFRPDDAPAATELLRRLLPQWVTTERGLVHWAQNLPERARPRVWVAEEDGDIAGWSEAFLQWDVTEEGVAFFWLGVRRDARRRGIGGQFYELVEAHLLDAGARRLETFTAGDPDAERFLAERGFRKTRAQQAWTLDPRTVDAVATAELERAKEHDGYRVVPLRELRDRSEELYALFSEAHSDVPSDHTHDEPYDDWKRVLFEYPDLDDDGSYVVLAGERPVSFAWLAADRDRGRATHVMTGTARDFRRRGLARLAKLATIRWTAQNGITTLLTDNDAENAGMLALNEDLGYEPTITLQNFAKDVR